MPDLCGIDVSRETIDRLAAFQDLLIKWNKQINLVARSTLDDAWNRHILDSAQIMKYTPDKIENWVDVGSGGGFPGIVAAVILAETQPKARVTLIESDQRKAVFLRTAVRTLSLNSDVLTERAEKADPQDADILSARALMPLDGLFALAEHHLHEKGTMLVLKGRTAQAEIDEAYQNWHFDVVAYDSLTDNEAKILDIRNFYRANR